jgi:CheY-like chemotaxis protein
MEAVGTLAGGLAHDFNNLLTVALGHTSLMLNEVDRNHSFYRRLRGIEAQIQSATALTRQLLGFARKGKYQVVPTDLNELVAQSAMMFGRTKRELAIVRHLQSDLSPVEIDRNQIEQVLLNLLVNAWHAMPNGGTLTLKTENVRLEESLCRHCGIPAGAYVQLSVTDTGIGMDEETTSRFFEPFFTTKERGKGTGLGLAASYGIIKNHGGTVNVASKKGEGTTFTICLPASERAPIGSAERSEGSLLRGSETILLIDDEEGITAIAAEMLNALGYNVLTARGGKEALETYTVNREQIDLVILDMIMPDMSGSEVFDRLKRLDPAVKVVLSSGYSLSGQAAAILERGCAGFMQKPYGMPELSKVVREALQGKVAHSSGRGE